MKKLLFLLLLVMTMPMTMMAQVEIDGIYYHFNGGNAEVINHYNQYTGDIVIPSTVTYNNVVYNVIIDNDAFNSCPGLTSVSIGKGVKRIGENAFLCCPGLTSITVDSENPIYDSRNNCNAIIEKSTNTLIVGCKNTIIPDDVTSIRYDAFYGCTGLTSITIPNSVTSIGEGAFENCTGLVSITVDSENPNYDSRNNCNAIIEKSNNTLMLGCNNTIIPDDVTSIGDYAFVGCSGLTSIDIPDGVTSIGIEAFSGCTGLTSIDIPNSVTSITTWAFANCEALEVVTCRATSVPDTEADAFDGSNVENATLIVPDEAYTAYSTISPWSKFGTIQKLLEPSVITANSYTREYGDANPTFEYTSAVTLNGTPTITCAADETSAPGTYPITISQGTVTNTGLVFVDGTLTVTKAPLTITANSYIIHEGDAMPAFEAVYEGLKNNESESVVNPVISCSATDSNTPGIYDINVTATSDNYDITIEAGTLTIMPTKMSITIGDPGVGTYCSPYDLDFSTVTDFKAYIAAGYNSATGNVIVVSVKDVPAGTGLFLKGTPGTYDVPCGESSSYYVNMLVGVTEATTISATDGSMTNFLLSATNSSDACFRPISSTYNLRANRAYLQIPTYMVGSSAGANAVGIEFEEGVTGIDNSLSDMDANAHWFTLDGRKLNGKPTQKGIYVVNGQKVVIK